MKKHVPAGTTTLILVFAGSTGINQTSVDDDVASLLMVRAVGTVQGDSSAYLAAKRPEHTAKAATKAGEWKTETANLKDQPSEFEYMIASTQGQTPTSLTYFDYQNQPTNTTVTVDLTRTVDPQVIITGDDVARKAASGGNIVVKTTSLTAGQELDVALYSRSYPFDKTTIAVDNSAQLNAVLSDDVIPGSSHYVVVKSNNKVGLVNVIIVSKDDLKKSGQPGGDGRKRNEPGLPRTDVII